AGLHHRLRGAVVRARAEYDECRAVNGVAQCGPVEQIERPDRCRSGRQLLDEVLQGFRPDVVQLQLPVPVTGGLRETLDRDAAHVTGSADEYDSLCRRHGYAPSLY